MPLASARPLEGQKGRKGWTIVADGEGRSVGEATGRREGSGGQNREDEKRKKKRGGGNVRNIVI